MIGLACGVCSSDSSRQHNPPWRLQLHKTLVQSAAGRRAPECPLLRVSPSALGSGFAPCHLRGRYGEVFRAIQAVGNDDFVLDLLLGGSHFFVGQVPAVSELYSGRGDRRAANFWTGRLDCLEGPSLILL